MSVVLVIFAIVGCIPLGTSVQQNTFSFPDLRFLVQPTKTYVAEGQPLTLACRAVCNCTGGIQYSWTRNGKNVTAKQTVGSFVVARFSANRDSGRYACLAEASGVVIRSDEIHVITARLTKVKVLLRHQEVAAGSIVVLKCSSDSIPEVKGENVKWYHNEQLLFPVGNVNLLASGTLVLFDVTKRNQGSYRCTVSNDVFGSEVKGQSVPLIVSDGNPAMRKPRFELQLANRTAILRQRISVTCIASGVPIPDLVLYKENPRRTGVYDRLAAAKGVLVHWIESVSQNDDGNYQCIATSDGLKVKSDGWIKVLVPPYFPSPVKERLVRPQGEEATLRCSVGGFPSPVVDWYTLGKKINSDGGRLQVDSTGKLRISNTVPEDSGIYQCFASNGVGSVRHSILFFVRRSYSPPRAPQNVTGVATSPSTISVRWDRPSATEEQNLVAYTVVWRENDTTDERSKVVGSNLYGTSIGSLFGGTVYRIFVKSYSSHQTGKASKDIFVKTPEGEPKIAPTNVHVRNDGNGKLIVTWSKISREFSNGHILRYTVFYGKVGSVRKQRYHVSGTTYQAVISGLDEGDLYTIEVAGLTSQGYGPASKIVTIKVTNPNETDLDKPKLMWKWLNKTAVKVNWDLPTSSIQVTGFKMIYINVRAKDYFTEVKILYFEANAQEHVINHLERKNLYRLELSALSNDIQGKAAHTVLDGILHNSPRLDPGDLSPPKDVQCETKDSNSIFLSWDEPARRHGLVDYTVYLSEDHTMKTSAVRTTERKYLFASLPSGTWFYLKATANKLNPSGKIGLSSRYIACKTFAKIPSQPLSVSWKSSYTGSRTIILWYPPSKPNGLVTFYRIRYRPASSDPTFPFPWKSHKVDLAKLNSRLRYPVIRDSLDLNRLYPYDLEVAAENEAGIGQFAKIFIPEAKSAKNTDSPGMNRVIPTEDENSSISDDEMKLGIIVGCSIAVIFFLILIVVIILKNPFRLKAAKQTSSCNGQERDATYLYLQRLHEGYNTNGFVGGDGRTYVPSSSQASMNGCVQRGTVENGAPSEEGIISRHSNTREVTGSSSGPPVCTCVCFQHGRNGHHTHQRDRVSQVSKATSTRDDDVPVTLEGTPTGSTASEERESAESADSRTQMLPSREKEKRISNADHKTTTRVFLQKVQETTFQI